MSRNKTGVGGPEARDAEQARKRQADAEQRRREDEARQSDPPLPEARKPGHAGRWVLLLLALGGGLWLWSAWHRGWKAQTLQPAAVVPMQGSGPVEGQAWVSPSTGMEFVWMPALRLWVGKYEVTNGEYRKYKPKHNSGEYKGHSLNEGRQPMVEVKYNTMFHNEKVFAAWMTKQDQMAGRLPAGFRYRLPSDNEWMAFAQCGDARQFPWGNNWPPPNDWNYYGQEGAGPWEKIEGHSDDFPVACPVEKSGSNEWGLYGVGGNVWEATANPADEKAFGVWRGGSWYNNNPDYIRCACASLNRYDYFGFRLVLSR